MDIFYFVEYNQSKTLNDLLNKGLKDTINQDECNYSWSVVDGYINRTPINIETYSNNNRFTIIEIQLEDEEYMLNYVKRICNDDNIIEKVKKIENINVKISLIKLIILYYNGGLVINDKIVLKNINIISQLYEQNVLVTVKSCLYNNLFNGFLLSKKNNPIIINTINEFIDNNIHVNNMSIDEILFKNINMNNMNSINNTILLNERIINEISYIYSGDTTIAEHIFSTYSLEKLVTTKTIPTNLSNLKIGITFDVPQDLKSFYCNGIRQNTLYLFELLHNLKYDVKLIIQKKQETNFIKIQKEINFYQYDYSLLNHLFKDEFHIIFELGFDIPNKAISILRKKGTKIVSYQCGNAYVTDSEAILYNQHTRMNLNSYIDKNNIEQTYDVVWSIPQNYKQNKYYWETLYRTKCVQVPFIWSSNSIKFSQKIINIEDENTLVYKPKLNKIAILEPNISLLKWALPCMLITEQSYRKYKNIQHVYITNIEQDMNIDDMKINKFNMNRFVNVCKKLDIYNDKKISVEKRFVTLSFMKDYADIVVSHQWENPLNYLYFDLAWMGWPILHNAYLCKDIGYYYSDFDYEDASEKLNYIINNHDSCKIEYMKENRKVIENYLPTNVELQNKYKNLIENLFL